MKKYFYISLIILLFYTLLTINQIRDETSQIINSYLFSFLPSLTPFLLIINFIVFSDSYLYLFEFLSKNKFGRFTYELFIIVLGIISGVPLITRIIDYHEKKEIFSKNKGQRILNYFSFPSLSFYVSICLTQFINQKVQLLLIIIPLTTSFFLYFLNYDGIAKESKSKFEERTFTQIVTLSFNKTLTTLGLILMSLILSVPALTILKSFVQEPFNYFFSGLIEFSYAMKQLSIILEPNLLLIIYTLGSLTLIIQAKAINYDFKILDYIKKRLLLTLVNSLLLILFI